MTAMAIREGPAFRTAGAGRLAWQASEDRMPTPVNAGGQAMRLRGHAMYRLMTVILMVMLLAACGCSDGGVGVAGFTGPSGQSTRCSTTFYDESIDVGLTPPVTALGPFYEFTASLSAITWFRADDTDLEAPWIQLITRAAILSLEDDAALQATWETWRIVVNEPITLHNGEPAWVISSIAPGTSLGLMAVIPKLQAALRASVC